jgi:hypothetical protein
MLKITREGMGRGADRQYHLLRQHWDVGNVQKTIHLFFNAFTRDMPRLERMKAQGVTIVSRVGGWHFDSAETTGRVLALSDGAIFVSEYTRKLAHKYFDKLPERQAVIINSTEAIEPQPLHDPPYLLIRAGGIGYPVWRKTMLERSLSIFALHAIWDSLRAEYPDLELRVIGRVNRRIKELVPPQNGIRYIDYLDDVGPLQALGAQAAALVHLVIGDHSPNTVCEIIGEGRPAIVLDKGGAGEVAGRAGIVVTTESSKEHTDLDNWWALDGRTYRPNLDSLRVSVLLAIESPAAWQWEAKKRAEQIASPIVAKHYMDFMKNL